MLSELVTITSFGHVASLLISVIFWQNEVDYRKQCFKQSEADCDAYSVSLLCASVTISGPVWYGVIRHAILSDCGSVCDRSITRPNGRTGYR